MNGTFKKLLIILVLLTLQGILHPCSAKVDNIILITIDTLRADHLSSYGYSRKTSPFIDSLAREGVLFKKAFAQSSTTEPSHASIFTSLYPFQHMVDNNGVTLEDKYLTLAEILSQEGFKTGAFTSNRLFYKTNFAQGFDIFQPYTDDISSKKTVISMYKNVQYRPGELTLKEALRWFKRNKNEKKLFAWIHLFDTHQPYIKHKKHIKDIRILSDKNYPFKKDKINWNLFKEKIAEEKVIGGKITENKYKNYKEIFNAYDSEIKKTDNLLKNLYLSLKKLKRTDNSLIIITSDHGECLGTHNWIGHSKNLYNEAIRIPLIFHFNNNDFKGTVSNEIVEQVDILPTILELINKKELIPDNAEGKSLISLLSGKDFNKPYTYAMRKMYRKKPNPYSLLRYFEEGKKYSIQNQNYKYIHWTEGEDELYNLEKDPNELFNLVKHQPNRSAMYKKLLLDKVNSNN